MKFNYTKVLEGAQLLKGKTALITGASRGIGKACASLFGHQGAHVLLVARGKVDLERSFSELQAKGYTTTYFLADVSDPTDIDRLVTQISETVANLDVLINNAGGGMSTAVSSISWDEWQNVLSSNLSSSFLLAQKSLPLMMPGSSIINVSSQAGRSISVSAGCHYTASKAGLLGLTRHLARELAPKEIRVNAVCPGVTETERILKRLEEKGTKADVEAQIPLGRIGTADEVAACCLFLASELASYVTGISLDVNGGALMM